MTPADPPPQTTDGETATEACTRLYLEHRHRLLALARALTGDPGLAEDVAAESHFRVRRLVATGHRVDPVPARLAATVRELAVEHGHAPSEGPEQGVLLEQLGWVDPSPGAQGFAYTDRLSTALVRLSSRQLRVLWLSEVEDRPLEAVARDLGVRRRTAAGLRHRARNGLRHSVLRSLPGMPGNPSCAPRWERMAALVSGVAGGRRGWIVLRAHLQRCPNCRDRRAALEQADARTAALLGPALLQAFGGGSPRRLLPVGGTSSETTLSLPTVRTRARNSRVGTGISRRLRSRAGAMTAIGSLAVAGCGLAGLALTDDGSAAPARSAVLQQPAASTPTHVNVSGTPTAASLPTASTTPASPAGASATAALPIPTPGLTSGPTAATSTSAASAAASGTAGPATTAPTVRSASPSPSATRTTRAPSPAASPTASTRPVATAPATPTAKPTAKSTAKPTATSSSSAPASAAPTTAAPSGSPQSASPTSPAPSASGTPAADPSPTTAPATSTNASTTSP